MTATSGFLMSPQQRLLWRGARSGATSPARLLVQLDGPLDEHLLERAFTLLLERHESLRTHLEQPRNLTEPLQVLVERNLHWRRDARPMSETRLEHFALAGPDNAVHVQLFGADRSHLLLVQIPAWCADTESLGRLVQEVFELYGALGDGELPEGEPVQYGQYCAWLEGLAEEDTSAGLSFWLDQRARLAQAPTFPSLNKPIEAAPARLALNAADRAELAAALGALEAPETLLAAAWAWLLSAHLGGQLPPIACAASGRSFEELDSTIGPLRRYLPVQPRAGAANLEAMAANLADQLDQVRQWQEHYDLAQKTQRETPYAFGFTQQLGDFRLGELAVTTLDQCCGDPGFALRLEVRWRRRLEALEVHFDPQVLAESEAGALLARLQQLLSAADAPSKPLLELDLLPTAERQRLLVDWNREAGPACPAPPLVATFRAHARANGAAPALVFQAPDQAHVLDYARLDALSDHLAAQLEKQGLAPGAVVGLCFERGPEMIVGLLAALKLDFAYVALDISWPERRLAQVLASAGAAVLLTHAAAPRIDCSLPHVSLDDFGHGALERPHYQPRALDEQLAYLVFTSGSTGEPKGVAVAHGQIRHYLGAVSARLGLQPGWRYGLVSTLAADLGNTSLYPALFGGGCLHVFSRAAISAGEAFARANADHPIDVLKITPSHLFALLLIEAPERILPARLLVLGGEAADWARIGQLRALAPKLTIANHYGPSETCVGVIAGPLADAERHPRLPLGKPLPGVSLYVLDPRMRPVPTGAAGELLIGGPSVAQGYRGRPAQTAERFVPDPFGPAGARLYRSGDLVRLYEDGTVVFLGRVDHQVKIGGYRVELGEVEAVLARHPAVAEVVVLALDQQLAAFVTAREPGLEPERLRQFAHQYLPDYMIPARLAVLDALPLNPNGKVDRKALAALKLEGGSRPAYAPPQTPLQQTLANIWEEVLQVEHVGLADDFFALGGQSLASIQVINKLQRHVARPLTLTDVFMHPTLAAMAAFLEEGTAHSAALVCLCEESSAPPLFLVHPSGGEVHWYHRLAQLIKESYRCYGIQAPGLLDPKALTTDLAELAASYIAMIRAAQPEGPYRIGGWSLGGSIALAMAQQLDAAGVQVEEVILIDAFHMADNDRDKITQYALLDFISEYTSLWNHQNQVWAEELGALSENERLPALVRKLNQLGFMDNDIDIADLERKFAVYLANRRAVAGYEPRPYSGRVRLIRARLANDSILGSGPDDPFEETYGWRRFGITNLVVLNVPGNHYSIFAEENIEELAETLARSDAYQPSTSLWFANHLKLKNTVGIGPVDRILRGIVGIFEASFPGRILGHYVVGSFAEGVALEESDLDIFIIFKDFLSPREKTRALELGGHCSYFYPQGVDVTVYGQSMMHRLALPLHPGKQIYGEPCEFRPEKITLDIQLRITMYSALTYIRRVRAFADYLQFPLTLPDPSSTFFGYAERNVLDKNGNTTKNTREIVAIFTRLARTWAHYRTGQMIVSKRAIPAFFREHIDADWGDLMIEMLELCRNKLHYDLPTEEADRQQLRRICGLLVNYENAFLEVFRAFLFDELEVEGVTVPWFSVREVVEWLGVPETLLRKQIQAGAIASRVQFAEELVFLPKAMRFFALKFLGHVVFPDDLSERALLRYRNDDLPLQRYLVDISLMELQRQKSIWGMTPVTLADQGE